MLPPAGPVNISWKKEAAFKFFRSRLWILLYLASAVHNTPVLLISFGEMFEDAIANCKLYLCIGALLRHSLKSYGLDQERPPELGLKRRFLPAEVKA